LIYDLDPIIDKVVKNLRNQGKQVLDEKRQKEEEDKKRSVFGAFMKKKEDAPGQQSSSGFSPMNGGGSSVLNQSRSSPSNARHADMQNNEKNEESLEGRDSEQ